MAKAVLINPNNGAIDTKYDPNDIDDPFSYRARDGFMGIGPLWANNDDGTVYMQGHIVIPNPWGNVSTNGTTTTTTDDTTDKDGGDDEGNCGMVIPEECKKILDAEADNYKNEPGDNFNCNEAHWDYDFYMCMMKYEKNEYDKSHYAKQARYALHCAIYERCSWVGSETNYMDLLHNEEMQKCSDKYSIKELEEAYLAGLGKTGSGYGVIGGCQDIFFE